MDKKETFWSEVGKKVPMDKVYDDLLHPALSEVGHALKDTVRVFVHPSFVEIIRQITPDEAKILKQFPNKGLCEPLVDVEIEKDSAEGRFVVYSNYGVIGYEADCEYPEKNIFVCGQFEETGIDKNPESTFLIDEWRYEKIVNSAYYKDIVKGLKKEGEVFCVKRMVGLTDYGMQLREICLS